MALREKRADTYRPLAAPSAVGFWTWLLQRVTAALVALFLGIHIWALHFAVRGQEITFATVQKRLQGPLYQVVDPLLLAVLIYHSLNGLRAIVLDLGLSQRKQIVLNWALLVVGVVAFVFGLNALWPFISGHPLF